MSPYIDGDGTPSHRSFVCVPVLSDMSSNFESPPPCQYRFCDIFSLAAAKYDDFDGCLVVVVVVVVVVLEHLRGVVFSSLRNTYLHWPT